MKFQLTPTLVLTTEHPSSAEGVPVLLVHRGTTDPTAYGPADMVSVYNQGLQPAAMLVARYGARLKGEQRQVAAAFLRQWPQGPQLEEA